jgi:transcriptional regulator with XRE-family HTH domain
LLLLSARVVLECRSRNPNDATLPEMHEAARDTMGVCAGNQQRFCDVFDRQIPQYVALIETARKLPTLRALSRIASALGTTVDDLLRTRREGDWAETVARLSDGVPELGRPLVEQALMTMVTELRRLLKVT